MESQATMLCEPEKTTDKLKMAEGEKRGDRRVPAGSGSYIIYAEGSGAIQDLSLSGLFVLDSDPLPVGTEIRFELRLRDFTIPARGVVARVVPGVGMGIRFVQISAAARLLLKKHIDSQGKPAATRKP